MGYDDKKLIYIRVPDYKNDINLWVKHKSVTTATERHFYTTYSANLYYALKNRCGGSKHQSERYVLYKNFTFAFEDFQHLAEWNNSQEAWGNRNENGKLWSLDKDILVKGNRIYSPEFCCFVPEYVNNAFILNTNVGDLPL